MTFLDSKLEHSEMTYVFVKTLVFRYLNEERASLAFSHTAFSQFDSHHNHDIVIKYFPWILIKVHSHDVISCTQLLSIFRFVNHLFGFRIIVEKSRMIQITSCGWVLS